MEFLNFVADNKEYFMAVTIPLTVIAVILSTKYTLNNLLLIKGVGDRDKKDKEKESDENVDEKLVAKAREIVEESIAKSEELLEHEITDASGDHWLPKEDEIDPVQFCEHIQSEVKKAKQRVATREIEQNLTSDEKQAEREAQQRQLEEIFKLMAEQNEKFGVSDVDDVKDQMKLYA